MELAGLSDLVEHWVRPEVRAIGAYQVPDARGLIKLDAMENPFIWPEHLRQAWSQVLREVPLNRYPDPRARELTEALREVFAIPAEVGLLLGNGSDELIQMLALTVAVPGRTLLSVDPGFVMYRLIATFAGMDYVGVPLRAEDFSLDLPALLAAIERHRPALIFLAYPNNPTGNLFSAEELEAVIHVAPGLVVVDEAYAPFTDASYLRRAGVPPNLMVMRTLSKMGLAGLRLGYLVGAEDWLGELDKVRLPYNVNVLTQASATFALRHRSVLEAQTAAIRLERGRLYKSLLGLDGVRPYPSEANFILLRVAPGRAGPLFTGLKEQGVLVKCLHGSHPLLADCLRVTVGLPEENHAFLHALEALL